MKHTSLLAGSLIGMTLLAQAARAGDAADTVRQFVAAFNRHDVDGMLELASEELRWLSVSAEEMSVETTTHDQLRAGMTGYFESIPSAHTEIRSITESGAFVHTVEEASWDSDEGAQNQCAMAVYELAGDKILNVWYFPAYECP